MIGEYNVMPSEYWRMTFSEVNLILEAKRPKMIGGVHESEIEKLVERRERLIEQGIEVL